MSITSLDQYVAATKQPISFYKVSGTSTDAWGSTFATGGNPGAATLAAGNTANGVVPTSASAGFPLINSFATTGYLTKVDCTGGARFSLFDCVFRCGAYAFNANTTLASQPSYSARAPGGGYADFQIWFEAVTLFTGTPVVTVTYTNQAGTAARTTGAVTLASAAKVGRMIQLPLQAGDSGVQKIESVQCATASAGTFNIIVLRPLWTMRTSNSASVAQDWTQTGMPIIYSDTALYCPVNSGTSTPGEFAINVLITSG